MYPDRFTKVMLVLIFLALLANLFRGMDWVSPSYARRVYESAYSRHTHTVTCDCIQELLKKASPRKLTTSPPEMDGGPLPEEEESTEGKEEEY